MCVRMRRSFIFPAVDDLTFDQRTCLSRSFRFWMRSASSVRPECRPMRRKSSSVASTTRRGSDRACPRRPCRARYRPRCRHAGTDRSPRTTARHSPHRGRGSRARSGVLAKKPFFGANTIRPSAASRVNASRTGVELTRKLLGHRPICRVWPGTASAPATGLSVSRTRRHACDPMAWRAWRSQAAIRMPSESGSRERRDETAAVHCAGPRA